MVWDAYSLIKATGADYKAGNALNAAEKAQTHVQRQKEMIEHLYQHVERLSLASQAMWELLREKSNLTDDDIEAKMLEIDLRDGKKDGKIGTQIMECPSCKRKTNSKRMTCVMCGAPIRRRHKFEG